MEYKILEQMFKGESPKSVFEIGVGGGGLLKDVSDHYGGLKVGGIDISKVRMQNLKNNFPGQEFLLHDLNDPWPVPDKSYDIVFSVGVLMYIFDPIPILREMFRVAKDKVIITEYHDDSLDMFGQLTGPFKEGDKIHQGIKRNYIALLKELGFDIEVQIISRGSDKTTIKCRKSQS